MSMTSGFGSTFKLGWGGGVKFALPYQCLGGEAPHTNVWEAKLLDELKLSFNITHTSQIDVYKRVNLFQMNLLTVHKFLVSGS